MNFLTSIVGKAHIILIAIAAVGLYTAAIYLKGGNDRERKIRDETKTAFFETVVHDTVYPQAKTMALRPRAEPEKRSAENQRRADSVIAASDSIKGLLASKLQPFSGSTEDSTLAISRSGEDTLQLHFRIDAEANPIDRVIAPLTLALAPFDLPRRHTLEIRTVWETDPWYYTVAKIGGGFIVGYLVHDLIAKRQ